MVDRGRRRPLARMRRGQVRIADLGHTIGAGAAHRRPVVIVSNDGANRSATRLGRGIVTVVPLTTNTALIHPFQVFLAAADTGLRDDCKAQGEQVRSIAVQRIGRMAGTVPLDLMTRLDDALRLHLDL